MKNPLIKAFAVALLAASLFNCSANVETPQDVPPNKPQSEDVGPFVIAFDAAQTYAHTLDIKINQDEGFVEYKINAGQRFDLVFQENSVTVLGCDAQVVQRSSYWFPNEADKSIYKAVTPGAKLITGRKTTGVLIHNFKNIGNCTRFQMKSKITKENRTTRIGQACENFSSVDQCKIESSCKEQFVTGWFYEIEVWNQQGALWAHKFLNKNDGTRTLSSSYSVKFNDATDFADYKSTVADQFALKINNLNYDATVTEKVNGQSFKLNVSCDL